MTNEQDVGADFLVHELNGRGFDVVRLNTERAVSWKLSIRPGRNWYLEGYSRDLHSGDCVGVWWRRPEVPAPATAPGPADEAVADQWRAFLTALATVPGPVWVSDPSAIRRAEDKALQLQVADELGLCLPETLWTNDVDEARAFIRGRGDAVVVKSVASAWWQTGEEGHFVFASAIESSDLPDPARVAAAPLCFQRRVFPKRDVRVTVAGETVHAAERKRAASGAEPLDWRLAAQRDWDSYGLPADVAVGCRELVRNVGLRFGGIDLVVDDAGQHWFLELNPNGEWGWLERAGLPIAKALADVLTGQA